MPELPEVEVLVRHLAPLLESRTIRGVQVRRPKVLAPTSEADLIRRLHGAKFTGVSRRGKYLLFTLRKPRERKPFLLVGHLGMTGRLYLTPKSAGLAKHAAVVMELGTYQFVYEDTRYFGRLTLDIGGLSRLGPEPLGPEFSAEYFARALRRSAQPIKVKLLDQALVAGIGNIYASEALYKAGISPRLRARKLTAIQVKRLRMAIRDVLARAIKLGSTLPLDFGGTGSRDGLFYYGQAGDGSEFYQERLLVYDRAGRPCRKCGTKIIRIVQAARSTFFCPHCQRA